MTPSTDNWITPFESQGHKCWLSCVHVRHSCVCRENESLLVRWSFWTYAARLKKQVQYMKIRAEGKLKGRGLRRWRRSSVSLLRVQKHKGFYRRSVEVGRGHGQIAVQYKQTQRHREESGKGPERSGTEKTQARRQERRLMRWHNGRAKKEG